MPRNYRRYRKRSTDGTAENRRSYPQEPGERPHDGARGSMGTLHVVSTPIGNLEDITIRAIRVLKEVRLIAAEDTRHTRILLEKYEIITPLVSLHNWNERERSGLLLERLRRGEDVAYVSDAGTPGISDPGYLLVREAIACGIPVTPVPGASALVAALSVSGLPMDSFLFLGFLPSKAGKRRQLLTSVYQEERTLIFYESPGRLLSSLQDVAEVLGDRQVVISREVTKIYEEFIRGTVTTVIAELSGRVVRGEVTLIIAGKAGAGPEYSDRELLELRDRLLEEGHENLSIRDIADRIVQESGVSRKRIYRLLLFP
jgi:16S rRNA (cytidine1402-2'-O)-methyltransferase